MKKFVDYIIESKDIHPVLCIRLENKVSKKENSYAIFWEGDRGNFEYTLFPNLGNIDNKVFGECAKIQSALLKANGDGSKAAIALDRENDLYEITAKDIDEMKHIPWATSWWKKDGGQPWLN